MTTPRVRLTRVRPGLYITPDGLREVERAVHGTVWHVYEREPDTGYRGEYCQTYDTLSDFRDTYHPEEHP